MYRGEKNIESSNILTPPTIKTKHFTSGSLIGPVCLIPGVRRNQNNQSSYWCYTEIENNLNEVHLVLLDQFILFSNISGLVVKKNACFLYCISSPNDCVVQGVLWRFTMNIPSIHFQSTRTPHLGSQWCRSLSQQSQGKGRMHPAQVTQRGKNHSYLRTI